MANSAGCGGDVNPETDANIMQFRVTKPLAQKDESRKPKYLASYPSVQHERIQNIRKRSAGARLKEFSLTDRGRSPPSEPI